MASQDEKKPPVGGFDVVESWEVQLHANGRASLCRRGPSGKLIESYRSTTREHAALDLVAIMQGREPLRYLPKALEPIGPSGY